MGNPWLVACVVSIATFMEVLDTSIANVALRYIAGDIAAGPSQSRDLGRLTSYLVSNAIIITHQRLAGHGHRPQALLHGLRRAVHRQLA